MSGDGDTREDSFKLGGGGFRMQDARYRMREFCVSGCYVLSWGGEDARCTIQDEEETVLGFRVLRFRLVGSELDCPHPPPEDYIARTRRTRFCPPPLEALEVYFEDSALTLRDLRTASTSWIMFPASPHLRILPLTHPRLFLSLPHIPIPLPCRLTEIRLSTCV